MEKRQVWQLRKNPLAGKLPFGRWPALPEDQSPHSGEEPEERCHVARLQAVRWRLDLRFGKEASEGLRYSLASLSCKSLPIACSSAHVVRYLCVCLPARWMCDNDTGA